MSINLQGKIWVILYQVKSNTRATKNNKLDTGVTWGYVPPDADALHHSHDKNIFVQYALSMQLLLLNRDEKSVSAFLPPKSYVYS